MVREKGRRSERQIVKTHLGQSQGCPEIFVDPQLNALGVDHVWRRGLELILAGFHTAAQLAASVEAQTVYGFLYRDSGSIRIHKQVSGHIVHAILMNAERPWN
jgi:hypothetical protein